MSLRDKISKQKEIFLLENILVEQLIFDGSLQIF